MAARRVDHVPKFAFDPGFALGDVDGGVVSHFQFDRRLGEPIAIPPDRRRISSLRYSVAPSTMTARANSRSVSKATWIESWFQTWGDVLVGVVVDVRSEDDGARERDHSAGGLVAGDEFAVDLPQRPHEEVDVADVALRALDGDRSPTPGPLEDDVDPADERK
jgi:hypothetical protein